MDSYELRMLMVCIIGFLDMFLMENFIVEYEGSIW